MKPIVLITVTFISICHVCSCNIRPDNASGSSDNASGSSGYKVSVPGDPVTPIRRADIQEKGTDIDKALNSKAQMSNWGSEGEDQSMAAMGLLGAFLVLFY